MSRFFDRIVAAGRSELAASLHRDLRASSLQPVEPEPAAERESPAPEPRVAEAPTAGDDPPRAVIAAPAIQAAVAVRPAPTLPDHSPTLDTASTRVAGPPFEVPSVLVDLQRAPRRAAALARAWIESPDPRTPRTLIRSLAAPLVEATPVSKPEPMVSASMQTKLADVAGRSRAVTAPDPEPTAPAPRAASAPAPRAAAAPARDSTALRAPQAAPRVRDPQRAPAAQHPPAPSHELVVEQLDVRIITEPPARTIVRPARSVRAPSLGAWCVSARHFLRQP